MQIFKTCLSVAVLAAAVLADAVKEAPTELKIDVTYKPSKCDTKAKTGDKIEVHYVSCFINLYAMNKQLWPTLLLIDWYTSLQR